MGFVEGNEDTGSRKTRIEVDTEALQEIYTGIEAVERALFFTTPFFALNMLQSMRGGAVDAHRNHYSELAKAQAAEGNEAIRALKKIVENAQHNYLDADETSR